MTVKQFTFEITLVGAGQLKECLLFLSGEDPQFDEVLKNNLNAIYTITRNHALHIIRTGYGMAPNKGRYALQKQGLYVNKYGRKILPFKQSWGRRYSSFIGSDGSTPLGRLSGELYEGVRTQHPGYMEINSGKDYAMRTSFTKPSYIIYVHDGKQLVNGRPFMNVATRTAASEIASFLQKNLSTMTLDNYYSVQAGFKIDSGDSIFLNYSDNVDRLDELKLRRTLAEKHDVIEASKTLHWWGRH